MEQTSKLGSQLQQEGWPGYALPQLGVRRAQIGNQGVHSGGNAEVSLCDSKSLASWNRHLQKVVASVMQKQWWSFGPTRESDPCTMLASMSVM